MRKPRVTRHTSIRYSICCHTRVNWYWGVCGKNLNIVSMCTVSPLVHTSNISSCQKNFFNFPVAVKNPIKVGPLVFLLYMFVITENIMKRPVKWGIKNKPCNRWYVSIPSWFIHFLNITGEVPWMNESLYSVYKQSGIKIVRINRNCYWSAKWSVVQVMGLRL
jgi:hypothetical protein